MDSRIVGCIGDSKISRAGPFLSRLAEEDGRRGREDGRLNRIAGARHLLSRLAEEDRLQRTGCIN